MNLNSRNLILVRDCNWKKCCINNIPRTLNWLICKYTMPIPSWQLIQLQVILEYHRMYLKFLASNKSRRNIVKIRIIYNTERFIECSDLASILSLRLTPIHRTEYLSDIAKPYFKYTYRVRRLRPLGSRLFARDLPHG